MYLKRLELQGFKSFAGHTVFQFGPGITGVVGPNGVGKSNVADAIRWVMGEQSARTLRARRLEDVIFSGSSNQSPVGMAEVSLVLDNSDGWLPNRFPGGRRQPPRLPRRPERVPHQPQSGSPA